MVNRLFLRAQGWGIDCQVKKKLQIPRGMPGGMVTGRIEPCINKSLFQIDSLDSDASQLSAALATTQGNIDILNITMTNVSVEVGLICTWS